MILIPLLLANNSTPPHDPVASAARAYSFSMINRLKNNRHEVEPLLHSMTHICGSSPSHSIVNWTQKIGVMPEQFYFTNNTVVYRELVAGGALMLIECVFYAPTAGYMGAVHQGKIILNIFFFAAANAAAGTYEVRCIPPNGPNEVTAVAKCGQDFLSMIAAMENDPAPPTAPAPKEPWWKRVF